MNKTMIGRQKSEAGQRFGNDIYTGRDLDLVRKIKDALKEPDNLYIRLSCFDRVDAEWFMDKFSDDELERIQFVWNVFTDKSAYSSDG